MADEKKDAYRSFVEGNTAGFKPEDVTGMKAVSLGHGDIGYIGGDQVLPTPEGKVERKIGKSPLLAAGYGIKNYRTLREANVARQAEWDTGGEASNRSWRFNELGGEVGETCNILKKLHRERVGVRGSRATPDQLAEELADIVICIDLAAMDEGIQVERLDYYASYGLPDLPTLTDHGNRLLAYQGCISAMTVSIEPVPQHTLSVIGVLGLLLCAVRSVARAERIDLDTAVAAKFNATSANNKLWTRLRYDMADDPKEAIPTNVYFCDGNFYGMTTDTGMGLDFYSEWRLRAAEFPTKKS